VLLALTGASIAAQKVASTKPGGETTYRVEVDSDELGRALTLLGAAELPTRPKPGLAEVFGSSGLLPTPLEERARYAAALSGELERSIEAMEGVVDARVHLALPDTCMASLDGPRPKGRASVMVKQRAGAKPLDQTAIRSLVAGATTEIEAGDIAVVTLTVPSQIAVKPELVRVGPITVTRASATALKTATGALFLLDIALAIALVILFVRLRRLSARSTGDMAGAAGGRTGA
jgi:type III secretion protein J